MATNCTYRFSTADGPVTVQGMAEMKAFLVANGVGSIIGGPQFSKRDQTKTPEFKRWFGDSKVVDADGKPLVVYHSTTANFDTFDTTRRALSGEGSYFSSRPVKLYGDEGENVMPVYLSLKNPKIIGERESSDVLKKRFIEQGYDGVIRMQGGKIVTAVAFYPTQIKSATGNNGQFDPNNPDIRYSKRDRTETPEFKRWFGDSKVVDADGKPLVVYHGTNADITAFNPTWLGSGTKAKSAEMGFFFAGNPETSFSYLKDPDPLQIKNAAAMDYALDTLFTEVAPGVFELETGKGPLRYTLNEAYTEDGVEYIFRETYEGNTTNATSHYKTEAAAKRAANAAFKRDWSDEVFSLKRGPNIMPVYLSLQNPLEYDMKGAKYRERTYADILAQAQADGHDGVIIRNTYDGGPLDSIYIAFKPTQIKSAIGNIGTYDPTNPDIRYSKRQRPIIGQNFTLPSTTNFEASRIKLQDDALRMKRVIKTVKEKGGKVGEAQNFYDANTLMPGRIQAAVDDFKNKIVKPLLDKAVKYKVELDELAMYSYAKHAKERNAYIASINKKMPDGGSGMTDAEADNILQMVDLAGDKSKFEELHQLLMGITSTTRMLMLSEGLITQDEFTAIDGAYDDYIPLRGFENVDEETGVARPGIGRGVNIRGAETIRALGRQSKAGDLIENVIRDYERVIARVEKNDVAKVLLDFVLSNPDKDLWDVDVERKKPSFNKAQGTVQYTKSIEKGEDTIGVKVGGTQVYIKFADKELTRALRQAWKDETSGLERATLYVSGWWNNWMRAVLTKYNPAFSLINIPKDALWSGTASALAELGPKGLAKYLAAYPKALMASARQEAGVAGTSNKLFGNPQMDARFAEFRSAGGITGGFFMRSLEDINQDLRDEMLLSGAAARNPWERIKSLPPFKLAKLTLKMLEFMGAASENATRFALYQASREQGNSPAKAAILAKDGTTNFNRKGEWGGALNNLYLFFNAGVQGTTQIAKVLKSPAVKVSMAGVTGIGMMLALYGASSGGEDDDGEAYWDKIPSFIKERNMVIMLPPGDALAGGIERVGKRGRYITIPVQYGFNIFPNAGYAMADVLRNQADPKRGMTPTKAALHMASVFFGSVNPLGGSINLADKNDIWLAVLPTIADLPYQISEGINTFGRPSSPEKASWDIRPDSERMFTSQHGSASAKIAKALNELGGGNEAKPGSIAGVETSITPGTVETIISATTGGLGSFVEQVATAVMAMTGDDKELKANKIPFLNKFYGEVDEGANIGGAGERMREVRKKVDELEAQFKVGLSPKIGTEEKRMIMLAEASQEYQKALTEMRKDEIQIIESDMPEPQKKVIRKQIQVQRDKLATVVNRVYLKSLDEQK